ncbi:hypothetical protein [Dokdonia sp. Hel_I_53]|uniref:hypothetical protein n=1 Tax=Dokdonia sp. Hel_I_53 TaxID=1566287 RepID=UPI00119B34A4|nr:hypothetical protein [Dokdonia sp. Hel_I_53]TVZ51855.1 hypothetical protein OD90_1014 [Dokdonia sp. Hel_I_53]
MDFFENLSPTMQIIVSILGVAILFFLVFANTKKNNAKQRGRRRRKFGEGLKDREKNV